MEYLFVLAVIWLLLGLVSYGLIYSWFFNTYHILYIEKNKFLYLIFFGPIAFFVSLFFLAKEEGIKNMFKYGLKF